MKKALQWTLALAAVYQVYLVTRPPSGLSAESILAGRAIAGGAVPYRDFFLHVGPLVAYLYAALYSVPVYAWFGLVFVGFNLLAAWGVYAIEKQVLSQDWYPGVGAILYMVAAPALSGSMMYVETAEAAFGIWAVYFALRKKKWLTLLMVVLATATKQTGIVFSVLLFS